MQFGMTSVHAACAEVRFVKFDLAGEWRLALALVGNCLTYKPVMTIDCVAVQTAQFGDLYRRQIDCEQTSDLPKLSTRNARTHELLRTTDYDLV